MGFRKRNAKRSDNRSSAKVIMGKPASQLSKEEKKILSARMAEIRSENGGKSTVQNTIPFLCMYQDGVCQVSENFFSLTVQFFDANYSISEFEEQNNIFSKYCDVINLFDNTIRFQLTFENQNRSKAKLVKTVQIPEQDDDFNSIRKEYSEMLTDKLLKGSNGQSARKFLTFGIESTSYKAARAKLMSIKNDVIKGFKAFGVEAELLDTEAAGEIQLADEEEWKNAEGDETTGSRRISQKRAAESIQDFRGPSVSGRLHRNVDIETGPDAVGVGDNTDIHGHDGLYRSVKS